MARKSNTHPAQPSYRFSERTSRCPPEDHRCRQELRQQGLCRRSAADRGDADVAQNTARSRGSAIECRTTRHEGYAKSINVRQCIEKVFGWIKQWGGLCQLKLRGCGNVSAVFGLHVIAYNLIRLGNLLRLAMAAA
jgi:hypothetical protein